MNKKFFIIAASITIFILILILLISPKKSRDTSTPLPSTSDSTLSSIIPLNLSKEKKAAFIVYTDTIKTKLPLYQEIFETSVGITTSINISHSNDDQPEIVHLNIIGLSYINKDELDESKNPNVTAFKESYLKAIEMLESQNIDPKRLLFSYSDVPYVHETATYWVDKLGLLR